MFDQFGRIRAHPFYSEIHQHAKVPKSCVHMHRPCVYANSKQIHAYWRACYRQGNTIQEVYLLTSAFSNGIIFLLLIIVDNWGIIDHEIDMILINQEWNLDTKITQGYIHIVSLSLIILYLFLIVLVRHWEFYIPKCPSTLGGNIHNLTKKAILLSTCQRCELMILSENCNSHCLVRSFQSG